MKQRRRVESTDICLGLSKNYIRVREITQVPLHLANSRRSRPKPAINGLSCMLFPFLPRKPHRLARPTSSSPSAIDDLALCLLILLISSPGVAGLELCLPGLDGLPPPSIAETEECAQRACLRMADVTVIHSVVIRATGSTATEIGVDLPFPSNTNGGHLSLVCRGC